MDPTETLIEAWLAWEARPGDRQTAAAKEDAIAALGLPGIQAHGGIAAWRRARYSVPDAVQATVLELTEPPPWKEAA